MFIVKKNGKRSFRRAFETYDEARITVRKWIRKNNLIYKLADIPYANPNLGDFGYSIVKV